MEFVETGAWLWLLAVLGGTAVLGIGLAYGAFQWRHRNRRLDATREAVVRENYREENRVE